MRGCLQTFCHERQFAGTNHLTMVGSKKEIHHPSMLMGIYIHEHCWALEGDFSMKPPRNAPGIPKRVWRRGKEKLNAGFFSIAEAFHV